ncbi:hypothetical protein ACFZDK_53740 [Streptomyces sp. NPDC007901]|uniref:hypothetical protein n=1 Tax=Streptomyces sp. NPDC007901 TaxID=3364785 RepID=UPI0036E24A29
MTAGLSDTVPEARIVPVLTAPDPATGVPPARALPAGGARGAEVTFRSPDAGQVVKAMADQGGVVVGDGTVFTDGQAERAVAAGARFVASPGLDHEVDARCHEPGHPSSPRWPPRRR